MSLQIKASALFPVGGVDWPRKLLIGGATGLLLELVFVGLAYLASEEAAFGIAPLAVIVNLPAIGYVVRAYEGALHRDAVDLLRGVAGGPRPLADPLAGAAGGCCGA